MVLLDLVPAPRLFFGGITLPLWVQPQEFLRGTEGTADSHTEITGVNQVHPGQSQSLVIS